MPEIGFRKYVFLLSLHNANYRFVEMKKLYRLPKYLKYRIFSSHKKGYGIHSPFVFNLITNVFRNKINTDVVCNIEKIRKKMLADKSIINVTDYGTGSRHLKGKMREVASVVKYSSVPSKYGRLLASLAGEFGGQDIVELGTSLGISTLYLASGAQSATIHTAEGSPELSEIASGNFKEAGCTNIRIYTGKFDDFLNDLRKEGIKPGLVFIDGDHRKDSLLRYLYVVSEMCRKDGVVIIDDIHSSSEMYEAWQEIKSMKSVSITIDIYRMGIVFFRKGIAKFDYVISY